MTAVRPPVGLEVKVEAMRSRHLRAVRQIDSKVYPKPWSLALYQQELARGASRVYRVARVGPSIVGYGGLMIIAADGHVTSVAVDPRLEANGIATRLMLAISRGAILGGCEALTLEVRSSNDRAQGLYRRFGFAPVGVRKDYYADSWTPSGSKGGKEDAIVMWASDVDQPEYLARLRSIEETIAGTTDWEST